MPRKARESGAVGRRIFAELRVAMLGLVAAGSLAASACGSGDGCSGFITINASAERCVELAEKLGCDGFETDGPACGLFACARCEDDD